MSSFNLKGGLVVANRYRIVAPLGHGAHGSVYEAVRQEDGGRVAVKVMHERHLDTTDARRFEREWALVQRLSGPHVVRIFDFGDEDLLPFIVFERLRGRTVSEELEASGRISVERTARIGRQVLSALEEAHALSIVHRDIKPANIFLCEGRTDFVKVLDFGTAKALSEDSGSALTATGQMLGTAQYMAPEQVRGAADVDETADLYSLGTVMAEMITGEKLVTGENQLDVYMKHISDDPLEMPAAIADTLLGPIIEKAVAKDVAQRWPSASAMAAALDEALRRFEPASELQAASASATEPLELAGRGEPAEVVHEPQTPGASVLRPTTRARPAPKRAWPWGLAGLLFVGGGGVAALVLSGRGPLVRWGAATRTAGALDDLTTDVVRAKLEKRGFEVREHTRSHQQGALEFVSFEFARGERKGYVQLYRWVDDEGAARGAQSLPAADHDTAVRRDGAVALVIVDSSGGAEALMASMVE